MSVWVVFDLDNTLILNTPLGPSSDDMKLNLFRDTEKVLSFLYDREIPITLASFRTNADVVLQEHDLYKYFSAITYTRDRDTDKRLKYDMIQELSSELDLSPSDAVFFDDMLENVKDCNQGLIYTIYVNPTVGVTLDLLFDALYNMTKHPLYILTRQDVNKRAISNYLKEYRMIFLDNDVSDEIAWRIADTDSNPVVLLMLNQTTIEYFYHDNRVKATHSDRYRNFDIGFSLLRELDDRLPQPLGSLIRDNYTTENTQTY